MTNALHALSVAAAFALVACSGNDGDAPSPTSPSSPRASVGGGSGGGAAAGASCAPEGTWVMKYTLDAAASDSYCEPIRDETYREHGGAALSSQTCDEGCTCTDDFKGYPTCGGSRSKTCQDADSSSSFRVDLARKGTDRYEGRAEMTKTLAQGVSVRCVYGLAYAKQ